MVLSSAVSPLLAKEALATSQPSSAETSENTDNHSDHETSSYPAYPALPPMTNGITPHFPLFYHHPFIGPYHITNTSTGATANGATAEKE